MSTFFAKTADYQNKKWRVIDAQGKVVGRIAAQIARILMGKDKTDYTPHIETGDGVVVINAAGIVVTGTKKKTKMYKNFSGYPSGLRERTFERVMSEDPTFPLKKAVRGMLPKTRIGKKMMTHCLVYAGAEHPHAAQKPKKQAPLE